MNRKKVILFATLSIIALAIVSVLFSASRPGGEKSSGGLSVLPGFFSFTKATRTTTAPTVMNDPFADKIVIQLQSVYGRTIADKSVQAGILPIRDFIMNLHPENGKAYFYSILLRAFPEYADEIMQTLDKLDEYNRWLAENRERLQKMTAGGRLAALEEKRKELFGRDADKIWSGEILASEARKAMMQDTLTSLDESRGLSIDQKMDAYRRSLHETYDGTAEAFVLQQGAILSKVFFSLDSVQAELNRMSPGERQEEINRLRAKMGFTEQQVESMARRDADNAGRWETGLKYMEQREAVVRGYQGEEREARLAQLRTTYFGDEADTIAREEQDNFYRFKRQHIWGRN